MGSLRDKSMILPTFIIEGIGGRRLDLEEEASLIYYIEVLHGRKPEYIVPIYYPLKIKEIYPDHSIVFDLYKPMETIIEYKEYDLGVIEAFIDKIDPYEIDNFLTVLKNLEKLLAEMNQGKYISLTRIKIDNIVSERGFLSELNSIIVNASPEQPRGFIPETIIIDEQSVSENIWKIINDIEEKLRTIRKLRNKLYEKYEVWKKNLLERFSLTYGEVVRSLAKTSDLVEKKISELRARMAIDMKSKEEQYYKQIDMLLFRVYNINREIVDLRKRLRKEIDKTRKKEITTHIHELEDEKKNLLRRINELRKQSVKDIHAIKKKYERLIIAEQNRIVLINKEKEHIRSRVKVTIDQADNVINKINQLLDYIEDKINRQREILENRTILTPPVGEGVLYIRLFLVGEYGGRPVFYTTAKVSRSIISSKNLTIKYYNHIRKYFSNELDKILHKLENTSELIDKYNLLKTLTKLVIKEKLKQVSMKYSVFEKLDASIIDREIE